MASVQTVNTEGDNDLFDHDGLTGVVAVVGISAGDNCR